MIVTCEPLFKKNEIESIKSQDFWHKAQKMQRNIERSKSTTQIEKQPQQPLRQSTSQSQRRITGGDNKQDNKTMSQSQSTLTQRDYEKLRKRASRDVTVRKVSRIQKVKRAFSTMGKGFLIIIG